MRQQAQKGIKKKERELWSSSPLCERLVCTILGWYPTLFTLNNETKKKRKYQQQQQHISSECCRRRSPIKGALGYQEKGGCKFLLHSLLSSLILDNKLGGDGGGLLFCGFFSAGCVIGRENFKKKSCFVVNLLCDGRLSWAFLMCTVLFIYRWPCAKVKAAFSQ